ncbi:MAG: hypothetical protein WA359_05905 [Acidimicrobiales bacterium]
MSRRAPIDQGQTSLDLLQSENLLLRDLFRQLDDHRGSSVGERYKYGNLAKQVIRHLAIRQSSLMNVADGVSVIPSLHSTADRMRDRGIDRRGAYDHVGDMARDVGVMSLNQGQDFDGPLTDLIDAATTEISWELTEAIPLIRQSVSAESATTLFSSAHYVQRHAPTKLHRGGPRWYEHMPVISRVVTVFGRLNNYLAIDHYRRHP